MPTATDMERLTRNRHRWLFARCTRFTLRSPLSGYWPLSMVTGPFPKWQWPLLVSWQSRVFGSKCNESRRRCIFLLCATRTAKRRSTDEWRRPALRSLSGCPCTRIATAYSKWRSTGLTWHGRRKLRASSVGIYTEFICDGLTSDAKFHRAVCVLWEWRLAYPCIPCRQDI